MSLDAYIDTLVEKDINEVEASPIISAHHNFDSEQHAEYDSLRARGRSLYDNLRTQKNYSHAQAWRAAVDKYGCHG